MARKTQSSIVLGARQTGRVVGRRAVKKIARDITPAGSLQQAILIAGMGAIVSFFVNKLKA